MMPDDCDWLIVITITSLIITIITTLLLVLFHNLQSMTYDD
jgi:hypothetical protein